MLHIALEIPLALLGRRGLFERHHACATRIQMFHEALDRSALARRIAAFKNDDHALPRFLHPGLQLEQLDLQTEFLALVRRAAHQILVRVSTFAPTGCQLFIRIALINLVRTGLAEQRLAQRTAVVFRCAVEQHTQRGRTIHVGLLTFDDAARHFGEFGLPHARRFAGHMAREGFGLEGWRHIAARHGPCAFAARCGLGRAAVGRLERLWRLGASRHGQSFFQVQNL